tara:strand:+ start:155 stop:772 length:618 start_codon:yes stop_codon:yes gene_type:complete
MDVSKIVADKFVYKMMQIVGRFLSYIGVIFGGYNRDMILHYFSSSEFFYNTREKYEKRDHDPKLAHLPTSVRGDVIYADSSNDVDTIDRLTIPHDIDIFARTVEEVIACMQNFTQGFSIDNEWDINNGYIEFVFQSEGKDYHQHPCFSQRFKVTTLTYDYKIPRATVRVSPRTEDVKRRRFDQALYKREAMPLVSAGSAIFFFFR